VEITEASRLRDGPTPSASFIPDRHNIGAPVGEYKGGNCGIIAMRRSTNARVITPRRRVAQTIL
jgi:hypothetical protein